MNKAHLNCKYCGSEMHEGLRVDSENIPWRTFDCDNQFCSRYSEEQAKLRLNTERIS